MGAAQKRKKKLKEKNYQKKVLSSRLESARKALVARIVKWNEPILKTPAEEVDNLKGNVAVARDLTEILEATKDGVGLASNQIGSLHRVFITRPDFPNKDTVNVFINPEITKYSDEKSTGKEGCLSYPGYYCEVERSDKIIMDYTDMNGEQHTKEFTDWHARIIQHEYDHLFGRCAIYDYWKSLKEKEGNISTL